MPFTSDFSVPGAKDPAEYLKSKGKSLDEEGLHYVQGWWTAAIMVQGIKDTLDAKKDLTGENIKASLEAMKDFSTGDVTAPISFSPEDHRGNDKAKIHQVKDGVWTPITDYMESRIPVQ
jgi:branched-chain amino acid transport system substrate-binding protein